MNWHDIRTIEAKIIFRLVIFLFIKSKNNAVLEPRKGHFQGLAGVEAKDLSFEATAKDFKCVLESKETPPLGLINPQILMFKNVLD